ncbi:Autophagy protein 22 [Lunasporangiospora selenospora]|uniref:Autophagy-related protein n=1 Tax=Lunasporangiospora selenospora TaxID=979761 RepID=A0A9P6FL14_9FUNG|nr:Autophagy protein 22 [Lunasporangiospora selenospora]
MADHGENSTEHVQAKVKIATFLSGGLSASGYVGGIVLVILSALIIAAGGQSARTLGFTMVMSAVYILIFMCAYAKLSYQRTAQPLPRGANLLTFGYVRIAKTVRQVRRLKTMFFYLCMWFILGDGLTSMTSMAVLIAKDQLKATNSALIIVALIQYVCAGLGMWFWIWLQNNKGVKPKTVIIINSCLFGLIPVYCLLGLIKGVSIGMKQTWEMYMLAAFFGLFIGAIGATNRVIFAMFIPLGHENELYALFEMVNTTSSWIGPLICAAIIESAGIRQIWWFLATQFFIPAAMLFYVDVEKGRQDAIEFYKNEQKEKEGTQVEEIHDEKDVKLV